MNLKTFISEAKLFTCNHIICHVPSHRLRLFFYRKVMKFKIGMGTTIGLNCRFDSSGGLIIGANSVINGNCRIDTRGHVEIGNNVSISEEVIILTADHDEIFDLKEVRRKQVIIEDYVWVGTRALILPGITVSHGAVIAASATVTKDVEDCNVVAGVPAKFIKKRVGHLDYSAHYKRLFQ